MKHNSKTGSTRTTRRALVSLLKDLTPVATRLTRRLKKIHTRTAKRKAAGKTTRETLELWGTLEDITLTQIALLAGISALVEVQVDVKTAFGEN